MAQHLTFSNKSNAVRGFVQHFPEIAAQVSTTLIRCDFIDNDHMGCHINLGAVADYQSELLGVVTGSTLEGVPVLRRSVSKGSVHRAHGIYDRLPVGTARKDAIAAAVEQGIAYFTARTQYQAWSKARAN